MRVNFWLRNTARPTDLSVPNARSVKESDKIQQREPRYEHQVDLPDEFLVIDAVRTVIAIDARRNGGSLSEYSPIFFIRRGARRAGLAFDIFREHIYEASVGGKGRRKGGEGTRRTRAEP